MEGKLKKLDCLLISPSRFYGDTDNIWEKIDSNFPPLGLASIAGYARSQNFSVQIIDSEIVAPSTALFEKYFLDNYAKKFSEIKMIGITSTTGIIKKAYQIGQICRKYFPGSLIVFGGVHPTFMAEEVISQPFVDVVAVGEGEITTVELLAGKNLSEIDGIVYKIKSPEGEKIITNQPRKRILNLDALPMPAYDLLPIEKYRAAKGSYKRSPAMSMMTSRGCPGRCTFCSKTLGKVMVFKSAAKIFEEIKYLIDNYGIKQIIFYDDTFTVFKANVIKLCDLLFENKIDLTWTCFARVDYIDLAMLKKMKQAGCHQIMYGVENINEQVLKNIKKEINLDQIKNAVAWTKKAGIECRLAFMVGNPGDNLEVIKENIKFVNKLDPDLLVVNITTPFPGTEMYKWADEKGLLLTRDWDDYTWAKPVMRLENLTVEEIKNLYKLMYRSFYFRPKYLLKKLLSIRSWDDLAVLSGGFRALWSFIFSGKSKK